MGSSSKSRTYQTSTNITRTVNAQLEADALLATDGSAAARGYGQAISLHGSSGNEITVTDRGAIAAALEAADKAAERSSNTIASGLATTRQLINEQVEAIGNFARTLKQGDSEGTRKIALAIIVSVVLAVLAFILKG